MLRAWLTLCAWLGAGSAVVVALVLAGAAWPLLREGLAPLWGPDWYPYEGLYGLWPAMVGTLWTMTLALGLALPCGLAAAVCATELMPARGGRALRFLMELLAGVPSVVYGLIGLWVLLPFLARHFDLPTGHGLLAAGLLLAVMVLPTLTLLGEDALRGVDKEQRRAAAALGLDWWQCLWRVQLPQAWPGIRSAVLLAIGRAAGETMAVMLVVGSIDRLPRPWYNLLQPAQTLTSRIGREVGEAVVGSSHWAALMASGLLLALATMGLALMAGGRGR